MRHAALVFLFGVLALKASGGTYYVDCRQGDDSQTGTSPKTAWKSLEKVNGTKLAGGDKILFRAGCVWQGQLKPQARGEANAPVMVDRYGNGAMPKIDGGGRVEDALLLYNVEFVEVRNLEITNHGEEPAVRRGVHLVLEDYGVARGIVIAGLYIHDVNGDNKKKDNGGIIFRTIGAKTPSRFDGLRIEGNIVWRVDRSAIAAQSTHYRRAAWFPSTNVVIRDNLVEDIGGDGIVPWACDGALVEHNIARDCNRRAGVYNAGIWPWSCDNTVLRLNEATRTRTTKDGQGFDSDYNSRNTLFEYNYSHDNEGGFLLVCSDGDGKGTYHIGNIGTTVRYNISRNDHARTFHFGGPVKKTQVRDNAVYIGPAMDVQLLLVTNWKGWADDAVFRNNLFYVDGTARYGYEVKRFEDGTFALAPGWGPAQGIRFSGNLFQGNHIDRPEDAEALTTGPAPLKEADFLGPHFDPSQPSQFPRFMARHRQWILDLMQKQFARRPPASAR